jgi:hypothetical protein
MGKFKIFWWPKGGSSSKLKFCAIDMEHLNEHFPHVISRLIARLVPLKRCGHAKCRCVECTVCSKRFNRRNNKKARKRGIPVVFGVDDTYVQLKQSTAIVKNYICSIGCFRAALTRELNRVYVVETDQACLQYILSGWQSSKQIVMVVRYRADVFRELGTPFDEVDVEKFVDGDPLYPTAFESLTFAGAYQDARWAFEEDLTLLRRVATIATPQKKDFTGG